MTINSVRQVAYVCHEDGFDAALDHWQNALGAGPFWTGQFTLTEMEYRGSRTSASIRIAVTFLGQSNIEVIAPLDLEPSPWKDGLPPRESVPVGGVFHHLGMFVEDFDSRRSALVEAGALP